jgi:hypothetical protein
MSNLINKIFGGKPINKRNNKSGLNPESSRVSDIGKPFLVKHNVHVGFNPDTGKIEGLPTPWLDLLQEANISKTEQSENPKAVIDALKCYAYSMRKKPEKWIANQETIDHEIEEIEHSWPTKGPNKSGSESPTDSSTDDLLSDIKKEIDTKKKDIQSSDKIQIEDKNKVKPKEQNVATNDTNGDNSGPQMRRKKNEVIKTLTEEEVMDQLRSIVNNGNPKIRYKIIKKIGSGASGTVFTAVDNETQEKVAIKTMDLAQQPKKELIITEIMVMKDNKYVKSLIYIVLLVIRTNINDKYKRIIQSVNKRANVHFFELIFCQILCLISCVSLLLIFYFVTTLEIICDNSL